MRAAEVLMGVPFVPISRNPELDVHPNPPDGWDRVAVITYWSEPTKVRERWPDAAVVGPLRSARGVDELARNLLANPMIRVIVVDGKDIGIGQQATDALQRMLGGDLATLARATRERIEYDPAARAAWAAMKALHVGRPDPLEDLSLYLPRRSSVVIPSPPVDVEERAPAGMPGDRIMAPSVDQAWLHAMDRILRCGREVPTQYGPSLELLDLVTVIANPSNSELIARHFPGVDGYYHRVTQPDLPDGAEYTYGSRIAAPLTAVESMLIENPLTRAAHVTPWLASDSGRESGRPCMVSLAFRALRHPDGDELTMRVAFRSHDYWAGYPVNLAALGTLLQRTADRRGMRVGTITCVSYSAHLYERDLEQAKELIEKLIDRRGIRLDARSTWSVRRVGSEIEAVAYTPDGVRTIGVFRGSSSESVRRKVEASGLLQEYGNALWLGDQLARAEAEG